MSTTKQFLLEGLTVDRLQELAGEWGHTIHDRRLKAPGIAKALARKRSLTPDIIAAVMTRDELADACRRVALAVDGDATALRRQLLEGLARATVRQLRREGAAHEVDLVTVPARLVEVIDGDTLRVVFEGDETLLRLRGVDAPESRESDKAEEDLDRAQMQSAEMYALGERSTARVKELLAGQSIVLEVQPTPAGPKKYLHHHQYRLLAYVRIGSETGPELGEQLLREGFALVWPRNVKTRRYLHRESERFVEVCNGALQGRPGLWGEGMERLCPAVEGGAPGWTLDDCRTACWRADWRDEATVEEAT